MVQPLVLYCKCSIAVQPKELENAVGLKLSVCSVQGDCIAVERDAFMLDHSLDVGIESSLLFNFSGLP